MKKTILISVLVVLILVRIDARKTSRSRSSSSSRGSSRKTASNPQPAPTSFSNVQASAPKPSLSGWQTKPKPAQNPANQGHSYPSSQTGLSGNGQTSQQRTNQQSHAYPASNGLSGQSGQQSGYPRQQGTGLSGSSGQSSGAGGYPNQQGGLSGHGASGAGYPQQQGGMSGASGHPAYPQQQGGYPHQQGAGHTGGAPPPYPGLNPSGNHYGNNGNKYHQQGPPPPYSNYGSGYGGPGGHHPPGYGSQQPGYFGNYGNHGGGGGGYGGMSRGSSALRGVGIAGAGVGTLLTGLALWNLARSTGNRHHTVIYDNRGQPVAVAPDNSTEPTAADSILGDLVNCTLTINNSNVTEVLAIPCSIATSFTPEAEVKDKGSGNGTDNTKCTVTVVTKAGQEFETTIPCSILLNSAAENNVTEPPIQLSDSINTELSTDLPPRELSEMNQPKDLALHTDTNLNKTLDCAPEPGSVRDPLNPCFAATSNLTVIPLTNEGEYATTVAAAAA